MTNFLEQVFNGLVSGSFYALLALGLAVIFGILGVVNFAHGAFYMLGAFGSWLALDKAGIGFWPALLLVPLALGLFGALLERIAVSRLASLDPLYNFLLTFGVTLVLQDLVVRFYGVGSQPYSAPKELQGTISLGLFDYPKYQAFVLVAALVVCSAVWLAFTRTRVGMVVRAATERPDVARALGVDVRRWIAPVFGFGIWLAGLSGVLAAPMRSVNPLMGSDLVITVFAVVVIGGLGSVSGAVIAGFALGLIEALGELYAPFLAQVLVFVVMAAVLLWRPAGLFGRQEVRA
ncbi:MAG: branched-chain amino acid ABC transporter permease [Catenulispora sp.]|nr:branched-chain amino acid ABC transporter permease [Catenulispora sp.]